MAWQQSMAHISETMAQFSLDRYVAVLPNMVREEFLAQSERAAEESRNVRTAMEKAEAAGREARAKTESLFKAADRLEEVAVVVSSASSEFSAQIEQSERGSSEQATRVAETATAMEEMDSTVLEVAKNAGAA